jgi:serine protease Do
MLGVVPAITGESPAVYPATVVGPSVVNLKVTGTAATSWGSQAYGGEGSGVVFREDGYIVTNEHVVSGSDGADVDTIAVTLATGEELSAEIVGRDALTDLAVIKVNKTGLPAASFLEDLGQVQIGEWAIAIGSPLGFENSVTLGVVSGLRRDIPASSGGSQSLVDLIQTDAAISPGNSGGALANGTGLVIGINVAYLPPAETGAQDVGFAIPAGVVVSTAQQLIAGGAAVHAYLGIGPVTITESLRDQFGLSREKGLLVANVGAGSPAAEAGIEQGDIIVSLDGQLVASDSALFLFLRGKYPGETVFVVVDRSGTERQFQVTLAVRPE